MKPDMSQYKKLDAAIIEKLRIKPATFSEILETPEIHDECKHLGDDAWREPFRVLDGQLQKLRKQGVITHSGKEGWMLK